MMRLFPLLFVLFIFNFLVTLYNDIYKSIDFLQQSITNSSFEYISNGSLSVHTTTTTKQFVPSIWGRLHELKENYVGSGAWISFLHSFLSSNIPSLRPLASVSCRITSIHVFFGLPCALLTCPKLIRSTRQTGASVNLRRT